MFMIPKSNTFVPPVLPTVLSLQCKALRCITLEHDGEIVGSFLREDTSISCLSMSYKRFQAVVILGLLVYSSIPLMWFVILWRVRRELNPLDETLESALELRKSHDQLGYLAFLFSDCEYVVLLHHVGIAVQLPNFERIRNHNAPPQTFRPCGATKSTR